MRAETRSCALRQPVVKSLLGLDVDLPDGLATVSLRAPACMESANVLREHNPQPSAINDGGWEKITLCAVQRRFDTSAKLERSTGSPMVELRGI